MIGLTILAFRYEGLRKKDFFLVLRHLRDNLEDEGGPYKERPSCQKFEQWILCAGRAIRGSKKREFNRKRSVKSAVVKSSVVVGGGGGGGRIETTSVSKELVKTNKRTSVLGDNSVNIFADMFADEDDLIWPLQLIDLRDQEQFKVLYPLLFKLPHAVMHYLNELIFPEVLAHQGVKLSTCGQELGGEILFGRRIGFSGTPSDILPQELGACQYERGSDGKVVHYLTSTAIVNHVNIPTGWNVYSLLDYIAKVII